MRRRPRRPSQAPGPAGGLRTTGGGPPLSRPKRFLFWLITCALPFLLAGLLESGLRVAGYGTKLALFTTTSVHGTTYYLLNHQVKARYFPEIQFSATASREYFRMPKPAGTFRIFVLGGSTAAGFPYGANGSFAAFLRERLSCVFPDRRVEVINLGMTGTNSYTVLDLARELPAYAPDLLLVYDGHNEFYGGLGVSSRGLLGGSRTATLVYLRLLHSRAFLLLRDVYGRIGEFLHPGAADAPRNVTLESLAQGKGVRYDSPMYAEALRGFEDNLADLRAVCAAHHLPLILSTQVSNLRGQPPFLSETNPALTPESRRLFDEDRLTAERAWNEHRWSDALSAYTAASRIDSLHAATHFAIGRCLDILGDRSGARAQYRAARDYDELRFRASGDFNRAILRQEGEGVGVVDMEALFMGREPDSLIGNELILEHLHPNSVGAFLMAGGYAAAMRQLGLPVDAHLWAVRDTVADGALWNRRTVTELDERIALLRTARLTSAYPFAEPSLTVPRQFPEDSLQAFALRVADGGWGGGDAHLAAARYYAQCSNYPAAEREYRTLISLDLLQVDSYLDLARLYMLQNRFSEASAVLTASLEVGSEGAAYEMLGDALAAQGRNAEAATEYQEALARLTAEEDQAALWYRVAQAELRQHHGAAAREALKRVLLISPGDARALMLMRTLDGRGAARSRGG